jgi:hypothetical protein
MSNEETEGTVIDIQCSMTVSNVRERRFLKFNVDRFRQMRGIQAAGDESAGVSEALFQSFGEIIRGVSTFCVGEVYGKDISNANELEDLEDDVILTIADAVLGQLEEEAAKKSEESSKLSLRVKTG